MKKCHYLFMLFVLIGIVGLVQAVVIENPDFESDGLGSSEYLDDTTPTGWTWNGSESRGIGVSDGNHFLWQGNAAYTHQITDQLVTAEGSSFTLQVDVYDDWESYPEITVFYVDDDENFVELGSAWGAGTDDTWETIEVTVTTTADSVGHYLGVALTQADETGWAWFDNVVLTNNIVTLQSPANEDTLVATDAALQWSVAAEVELVDVYFGTEDDPNLSISPNLVLDDEDAATTSYYPTMNFNTTYYWKVIAYEPNEAIGATDYVPTESDVYSFTTAGPSPIISTISPNSQSVAADVLDDAVITVTGTNLQTFIWSKDGTELTDTTKYSGLGTAELTVNDITLADEGVYTVVASNSLSEDTDTASATVVTERLMGWWKLDGNLDDSVQDIIPGATEYNGVVNVNTLFTTDNSGIDNGNSLIFDIDDPNSNAVVIPGTEQMFNFYEDQITVSMWLRTTYASDSEWPAMVSKSPASGSGFFVALDGESEVVTEIDGTRIYTNGPTVDDGEWHMITMTYDGSAQKIYIDGQLQATSSATVGNAEDNLTELMFAAWDASSESADFDGNIDDIKIYSYALTTEEIGNAYVDMNPEVDFVCNLEAETLEFDFDNNCRVDLEDFAQVAATWLACNRIPASACY